MSETAPHIVKSFAQDLQHLRDLMARMGGIVENQVSLATRAVVEQDASLAARAVEQDPQVDALERETEAFVIRLLALRQPMAIDLRQIVAALKITGDLERIGDYATNVAKRGIVLSQGSLPCSMTGIAHMSRLVQELPAFSDFHPTEIANVTETCLGLLDQTDGLDTACSLIRETLPPRLRETAYLLACEVAAADGDLTQEELQFLQDFRIGLDLDRLIAGAIERAARARYQVI